MILNGGELDLANDTGLDFGNATVASAAGGAPQIVSDRLTAGAGVTYKLGALTIGNATAAPVLTIGAGALVLSGTAGVTFGDVTLTASGSAINTVASTNAGGVTTLTTLGAISGDGFDLVIGDSANAYFGTASVANTVINGPITTGSGALIKNGLGTLTIAAAGNTDTGGDHDQCRHAGCGRRARTGRAPDRRSTLAAPRPQAQAHFSGTRRSREVLNSWER